VSAGTTRGRGLGAASLPADGDPDGGEGDAESEVAGGLEDLAQPASTNAKDKRHKVPAIRERLIEFLRITSSFFEDTPIIADVNRVVRVFRGLVACFAALPSQTESGRGERGKSLGAPHGVDGGSDRTPSARLDCERGPPATYQGPAWLAADSGQVMHLETNLLEIALEESAVSVEYAPVKFKTQNVEVWLPQFAVAFTHYRNCRMIIEHTFSDFQLFSVQTQDVIQKPKEP
jgi:hypothetical protein